VRANHDLIQWLDKPGVFFIKEISFFEQGVGSASSRSALFSGRAGALTCKQATKNNYFIKVFSSCLNELQALAIKKSYPDFHAVR
jgi:hypothetical protein